MLSLNCRTTGTNYSLFKNTFLSLRHILFGCALDIPIYSVVLQNNEHPYGIF